MRAIGWKEGAPRGRRRLALGMASEKGKGKERGKERTKEVKGKGKTGGERDGHCFWRMFARG